jgi:protein TonB
MASTDENRVSFTHLRRPTWGERLSTLLSLAVHGGLLLMLVKATAIPGDPGKPDSLSIDIVTIASPPRPEPEPEPPEPKPPEPKPPEPKPVPIVTPQKQPPPPRPSLKPTTQLPATPPPSTSESTETATEMVAVEPPPPPSSPPPSPSGGTASPDDSLRQYGQIVWARIAAHKPRGVRLPGTATITFAIGRDGRLISAQVTGSDGESSLDRVALSTLGNAAPFPPPPPHATPAQLVFSIPFHFR